MAPLDLGRESPYTAAELSGVLVPEGFGAQLPKSAYLAEDVARFEGEYLWTAGWTCVTSTAHLAQRGHHFARLVGNQSLVITRDDAGTIRAFYNVCQHRGCELVAAGSHTKPRMVCPYHAWIYAPDGSLERAPYSDALARDDAERFDLVAVRSQVLHGLVFVDLSGQAGALADELGPLGELLHDYGVGDLKLGARLVDEIEANWKVVAENSLECNHCPVVHPEFENITSHQSADESVGPGPLFISKMQLDDEAATFSMDGTTNGRPILAGLDAEQRRSGYFVTHFPGFLVSFKPDGVILFWYWPGSATSTHSVQEFLFAAEVIESGMDVSDAVEFTSRVARQDWEVCEKVQKGLSSQGYRGGVFSDIEGRAHAFNKFMAHVYLTGTRPLRHEYQIRSLEQKVDVPPPGGGLRARKRSTHGAR